MRKKFGREIALLTLPVLIIGGVALWKTRAPRDISVPPSNIESGAPRVEWNGFRAATVTPAEVGRGLTAKLETTLWSGGEMPPLSRNRLFFTRYDVREQKLRLVYRQKKRWKAYVAPDGTSGIRRQVFRDDPPQGTPQPKRVDWKTTLWLPLAALPRDAADVRLRGQWKAHWATEGKMLTPLSLAARGKWDGSFWTLNVSGKPFDVPLSSIRGLDARVGVVPEVSQTPTVTLLNAEGLPLPQGVSDGERLSRVGDGGISLHLTAPKGNVRWKNNAPRELEYRLLDQNGRDWTKPSLGFHSPRWFLGSGMRGGGGLPDGEWVFNGQVSLGHIPASAGAVRLKMWISDDSDSWPLVIEREVRPKWVLARTSHLQIESVRVVKGQGLKNWKARGNGNEAIYGTQTKIEVVVRYLGTKRPIPRGFTQQRGSQPPKEFWSWAPDDIYKDPLYRGMIGEQMPVTPRDEDLIFHWSQRVENARGKEIKVGGGWNQAESAAQPPDQPKRLDPQGKRWLLRYGLYGLPRRKKGEKWRFRAQLGIAGEGFVPIEVPLDDKALG